MTVMRFSFLITYLNWDSEPPSPVLKSEMYGASRSPRKASVFSEMDSLLLVWCTEKIVGGGHGRKHFIDLDWVNVLLP